MNKEKNITSRKALGYETPSANVVSISIECVLCTSNALTISDWEENPDAL